MGNIADGSLDDWAFSVQRVINEFTNIEKVVPGHGSLGSFELLTHTQELARKANSNIKIQPTAD